MTAYGRNFGGRWQPTPDSFDFGWTPPSSPKRFLYLSEAEVRAIASHEAGKLLAWERARRVAQQHLFMLVAIVAGLGVLGAWGVPW